MNIQAHTFSCSSSHFSNSYFNNAAFKTLVSARNHFAGSLEKLNVIGRKMLLRPVNSGVISLANWIWNRDGFVFNGILGRNLNSWKMKNRGFLAHSVSNGQGSSTNVETKSSLFGSTNYCLEASSTDEARIYVSGRKVVEHISLLKAKEDLSDEDEKDMLDFLYTTQYQMGGIIAISLGRLSSQNVGSYTHAVFMRFQRREDLVKFYENPFYLGVLKDHVTPYCHGITYVDYESEVEDDILPIFRKGEEFNTGVEFILVIQFAESSLGGSAEDAMASIAKLSMEFPSLIVQATQGSNFNLSSKEYTHGVVIRFRSSEAFKIFMACSEYKDIQWVPSFCNTASLIPRIHKEVILGPPWLVSSLKTTWQVRGSIHAFYESDWPGSVGMRQSAKPEGVSSS